jgi:hypothetical protein
MFKALVALSVIGIAVSNPGAVALVTAVVAIGHIADKNRK